MVPDKYFLKGNNYVIRSQGKRPRPCRVCDHSCTRRHRRDCCHALARTQDRQRLQLDQQLNGYILISSFSFVVISYEVKVPSSKGTFT